MVIFEGVLAVRAFSLDIDAPGLHGQAHSVIGDIVAILALVASSIFAVVDAELVLLDAEALKDHTAIDASSALAALIVVDTLGVFTIAFPLD